MSVEFYIASLLEEGNDIHILESMALKKDFLQCITTFQNEWLRPYLLPHVFYIHISSFYIVQPTKFPTKPPVVSYPPVQEDDPQNRYCGYDWDWVVNNCNK